VNKEGTKKQTKPVMHVEWLMFPTLARACHPSSAKVIAHLMAKHKEYQILEESGGRADQVRARLISASYARTYELLQELEGLQTVNRNQ
jgi:hypothetical protein